MSFLSNLSNCRFEMQEAAAPVSTSAVDLVLLVVIKINGLLILFKIYLLSLLFSKQAILKIVHNDNNDDHNRPGPEPPLADRGISLNTVEELTGNLRRLLGYSP